MSKSLKLDQRVIWIGNFVERVACECLYLDSSDLISEAFAGIFGIIKRSGRGFLFSDTKRGKLRVPTKRKGYFCFPPTFFVYFPFKDFTCEDQLIITHHFRTFIFQILLNYDILSK